MKKILFLLFAWILFPAAFAQTVWTVETVPNTRYESNLIHVSDPDGYLSDSAEKYINNALNDIRSQADVFLVTLYTIGYEEPKHFATTLFNDWGIGDAETDNGVLLLFVEDQHALEFETGYGAESVLTDARCAMIFNNTIVPYFKMGDYEGGLCAGVADIVEVYGGVVPMGLRSSIPDTSTDDDIDLSWRDMCDFLLFCIILFMMVLVPIVSFLRWIGSWAKKKKNDSLEETCKVFEQDGVHYISDLTTGWKSSVWEGKGFRRFLLYGVGAVAVYVLTLNLISKRMPEASDLKVDFWIAVIGWVAYSSLTCLVQNAMLLSKAKKAAATAKSPRSIYTKAKKDEHSLLARIMAPWFGIPFGMVLKKRVENSVQCVCPSCGADMIRDDSFQLPAMRAAEKEAGAYDFTPCRCQSGHVYVLRDKGSSYNNVKYCKSCGAFAAKKIKEKTLRSPSYTSSGTREITYECQYCHEQQSLLESIPKLVRSTSSSSSHSHHSYHSSSHSHGSFGGGHSGGGGYSGRW